MKWLYQALLSLVMLACIYGCRQDLSSEIVEISPPKPTTMQDGMGNESADDSRQPTASSHVEEFTVEYSAIIEKNDEIKAYSNPIDAYFMPVIENPSCEMERREYQDGYLRVWEAEYRNVLIWMRGKCIYQEDKDNLQRYAACIKALIEVTHDVLLPDYDYPPGSFERDVGGNGTRSRQNQIEAEIYRDASRKLIDFFNDYEFLNKDYSLEHWENTA